MQRLSSAGSQFGNQMAFGLVLSFFAAVGLLLIAVGLYGVTSYSAARRTREFGIRVALGARRSDVAWLVQKETLRLVAIGTVAGLGVSIFLMLVISWSSFGIPIGSVPIVPSVPVLAVFLMLAVASLAGYLPSRRASACDPVVSLRNE
jgi:ABC-type antimicrobial peptide transport system permease subunit